MGQQSFKLFCESRRPKRQTSSFEHIVKISKAGDGVQASKRVQNSEKINTKISKMSQSFWEFRPFSRIVNWGRDFKTCVQYLKKNVLEALGFVPYKPRKDYYSKWLKDVLPDLTPPIDGESPP